MSDTLESLDTTDTDAAHIEVDVDPAEVALVLTTLDGAAPVALLGAAVIWFLSRLIKRRRAKPTPAPAKSTVDVTLTVDTSQAVAEVNKLTAAIRAQIEAAEQIKV